MIRFEQKKSRNTMYFYLTERVLVNGSFKKIQVFLGKNVPTDTRQFYAALQKKELALLPKKNLYPTSSLLSSHYHKIERSRLNWKYFAAQQSEEKILKLMTQFAITFIYESNAIEGSRLSQKEVEAIIRKQYVKKSLPRHEIQEAENAIRAFILIQTTDFTLTQKSLKLLHSIVTEKLDVPIGFKKENIVVNNKQTTDPKDVRIELQKLFSWYKNSKSVVHPFERAIIFHNRFEHIHPFTDGNGRVGRLLLNWMLIKDGYGAILFRNRNHNAYFSALNKGDEGHYRNLITLASKTFADTITELTR